MKIDIESAAQSAFEVYLSLNARGRCPKDSYEPGTFKCDPSLSDAKTEEKSVRTTKPKEEIKQPKSIRDMSKPEFINHIEKTRNETLSRPEVLEAISTTEGAKITPEGLELTLVRYQEPEMAGSMALRGAVFYLPEKKSPYAKYYTGHKNRYGGTERFEGKTVFRNPMIIKGATGGTVPERAYVQIKGKQSLKDMQRDILKVAYTANYDDFYEYDLKGEN